MPEAPLTWLARARRLNQSSAVRELHEELLGLSGGLLPVTAQALALAAAYESRGALAP